MTAAFYFRGFLSEFQLFLLWSLNPIVTQEPDILSKPVVLRTGDRKLGWNRKGFGEGWGNINNFPDLWTMSSSLLSHPNLQPCCHGLHFWSESNLLKGTGQPSLFLSTFCPGWTGGFMGALLIWYLYLKMQPGLVYVASECHLCSQP